MQTRTDALILSLLQELDFFSAVPLGGSATYMEIAKHTQLPESLVRRLLRYSMIIHLFAEREPGSDSIVHTGITAHAARSPEFQAWICHVNVVQPAAQILPQVLKNLYAGGRQSVSEAELESAFCVLDIDKTGKPTNHFEFLKKDEPGRPKGWRELIFAQAIDAGRHMPGLHIEQLLESSFDWDALGEATVVDIGGSGGHDAIILARRFPRLKFIVQDRPEQQAAFDQNLPADLKGRICFQPHDFFSPQPVQDASIYMLKHVLHDWPDTKAIDILRSIVPVMTNHLQRIVLFENVAFPAKSGTGPSNIARTISAMDMFMLIMGNGKERSLADWELLIEKAGSHLKLINNHSLPGVTAQFLEIATTNRSV